jgi:hypothetical protein
VTKIDNFGLQRSGKKKESNKQIAQDKDLHNSAGRPMSTDNQEEICNF